MLKCIMSSQKVSHMLYFVFDCLETSGGLSYPVALFTLLSSNIGNTVQKKQKKMYSCSFLIQSQAILVNHFLATTAARPPAVTCQVFREEKNAVI